MTNRAKAKGDRAELEVQGLLRDLLGVPARRKLGAGRADDMGDIDGVPDTVIQVVNYQDVARAIREKLPLAEAQRERAGCTFAATFVRRPGGKYVVVLTPEQWATYARETLPVTTHSGLLSVSHPVTTGTTSPSLTLVDAEDRSVKGRTL